jgi:hypothetical protein
MKFRRSLRGTPAFSKSQTSVSGITCQGEAGARRGNSPPTEANDGSGGEGRYADTGDFRLIACRALRFDAVGVERDSTIGAVVGLEKRGCLMLCTMCPELVGCRGDVLESPNDSGGGLLMGAVRLEVVGVGAC